VSLFRDIRSFVLALHFVFVDFLPVRALLEKVSTF